jgi:hypothetical protein
VSSSPDISAIVNFSRELRNAREFRSITLSDVERKSRIAIAHLEALESAHWDDLPVGFLRGFVGLYAEAVGMNRDRVLRDLDSLIAPEDDATYARLVSVRPLLSQPEPVGLTRAKIAAAWFSDLTTRSHLKKILTVLALFAVIAGPAWLRREMAPAPPSPIPFSRVVAEYRNRSHGPMTEIPLISIQGAVSDVAEPVWLPIIATSVGHLEYMQDHLAKRSLHYSSMDTLKIQYIEDLAIVISPAQSAFPRGASGPVFPDSIDVNNRAFYHFQSLIPPTESPKADQ